MIKKTFFVTLFVGSSLALAEGPLPLDLPAGNAPNAEVACEVQTLEPATANFFSFGRTPRVGDKIKLDLSVKEIDDLTFESGARIPLKEIGAKLTSTSSIASFVRFRGSHTGSQGEYQGLLFGFLNEKQTDVFLNMQVLRESAYQGFDLHKMTLKCTVTN